MNTKTCFGDYRGEQLAQRLPVLPLRVGNSVRGQSSSQILLKSKGYGAIEGEIHWRRAEFSCWISSEVRALRQGAFVILSGLHSCSRRSCYIGQGNRVVRR